MDASQALAELRELSAQIASAVVLGADGAVLASTSEDSGATERLAGSARDLITAAGELGVDGREVTRVEVELAEGGLFVISEGGRTIAATTGPEPTSGLVVYDLRTCLRSIDEPAPKRRRSTRKAKEEAE